MPAGTYVAIFDLDGVLTSTSARHEQSWADAAAAFGFPVSADSLKATRSVPRATSLAALLAASGTDMDAARREVVMAFKNARYLELIDGLTPDDAFTGARAAVEACRDLGMAVAVASASLNAREVLERIGVLDLIDHVADPRDAAPKPSAEIYGRCCAALGALPQHAACIEDGAAIIANLRSEGVYTVGIGETPLDADEHARTIADWDPAVTLKRLKKRR